MSPATYLDGRGGPVVGVCGLECAVSVNEQLQTVDVRDIERLTEGERLYRNVQLTVPGQLQVVTMYVLKSEGIDREAHAESTQFIRVEEGTGYVRSWDKSGTELARKEFSAGSSIVVPKLVSHQIVATSDIRLYSVYAPPAHPPGTRNDRKPASASTHPV